MIKKKTENKTIEIKLNGDLIIANIEKTRKKLLKEISNKTFSLITFENVSQIDLPGIQLIESLIKSQANSGKDLKIKLNLSKEYMELLVKAGFQNFLAQVS